MNISDRRTGTTYDQAIMNRALAAKVDTQGASGYFSTPAPTLDPHLFSGTVMHPEVRAWVLKTLYTFWDHRYHASREWSRVWIAGSGVTYQWSAGRESGGAPGDLDTLVGVDFPSFFRHNPTYSGFDENGMAQFFNDQFRQELNPTTAVSHPPLGGVYETTFYVNPGATDIRSINPYAAYDVTSNDWTVPPIRLPGDWGEGKIQKPWWDLFHKDHAEALSLVDQYRQSLSRLSLISVNTPQWLNEVTHLHAVIRAGRNIFDRIHEDRHNAFGPGGGGFHDFYNAQWQAGKLLGTISSTLAMARVDKEAHQDYDDSLYDGPLLDAAHALRVATLAAANSV